MSADDQRARRAADDGLGVVDHLGHRHADRRSRSRACTWPSESPTRSIGIAGLVEQLRGREVVGRQHRDAARRRRTCGRCRRRSGGGAVSAVALMLAPTRVGRVAQSARRRRARPAPRRRDPGCGPPTSRLVSSGRSSREPSAARIVTRFVSVPNPEPGSATSLATSRSTPLRRSLSAARSSEPVSAAKPTSTGRVGLARRRALAVEPVAIGARRAGPASIRARASARRRAAACARRGRRRPEVRDGGGHHEGIEAAAAPSVVVTRTSAVSQLGGRTRRGRRSAAIVGQRPPRGWRRAASPGRRDRGRPRPRPGPSCPVERLPMKRTGSIGLAGAARGDHDVPAREVRLARDGRPAAAAPPDPRPGSAASPTAATTASTMAAVSARRPTPDCPDASGPAIGLHDRVAEVVAQPGDVGRGRGMGPHVAVHRGARRRPVPRWPGRWRSRRRRPARWPSRPASARSPAPPRSRPPRPRPRCGRSGRRAAGPAGRSRRDAATARRTSAGRRTGWRTASASPRRRRPRRAARGAAPRPCRPRSSR